MSDFPKIYEEKYVTSRKLHICSECNAEIVNKQKYYRISGLWDSWMHFNHCEDCHNLWDEINCSKQVDYYTFPCFGYLFEFIFEYGKYRRDWKIFNLTEESERHIILTNLKFHRYWREKRKLING